MRQVAMAAKPLLTHPWGLLFFLLLCGEGLGLLALPLFDLPGYEWASAMAIGVTVFGGALGLLAARQEKRRSPAPSYLTAFGAAVACTFLALLLPFLAAWARARLSTRCDPFAHIAFVPLLLTPTLLLSVACAVFFAGRMERFRHAVLGYALAVMLSLGVTAWPLLTGPQVFAFNHFAGYLPGPLYDETLQVNGGLLVFRGLTLLWALWFVLAGWATFSLSGAASLKNNRALVRGGLAAFAAGLFFLEAQGPRWGFRMNHGVLAQALGGQQDSRHFTLHFPKSLEASQVERMLLDLEFRHAQLRAFLGLPEGRKVRVFLYESSGQKQALVGASRTQFAKPWLSELHVNPAGFPHPVLKHELAHVLAAPLGKGPFAVSSRFWVLPLMGLVEGLAVAAEDDVDGLTVHEWAAGMQQKKLLPDLWKLLSLQGFYTAAPGRAYIAVGSFLRYLRDTHGPPRLRALYAHSDFEASYGRPLESLAADWEAFLQTVVLDEETLNLAFARFRRESLFARSCAREVEQLAQEARVLLSESPEAARSLFARCARLQPEEPSFVLGQAEALGRLRRFEEAESLLDASLPLSRLPPSIEADVALFKAHLAVHRGEPERTQQLLERVLELKVSPQVDRTAHVMLAASRHPPLRDAVFRAILGQTEEERQAALDEALQVAPDHAVVQYLVGRRLHQKAHRPEALTYLEKALLQELPPSIEREALRLLAEASYLQGKCAYLEKPSPRPAWAQTPTFRQWRERCAFDSTAVKAGLVPSLRFR